MTSIIKVDQIQTAAGAAPTANRLRINTTGSVLSCSVNNRSKFNLNTSLLMR